MIYHNIESHKSINFIYTNKKKGKLNIIEYT